jgi:hypothetical protein
MTLSDPYSPRERESLLRVARESVVHGVRSGQPVAVDLARFPSALTELRATFVTLHKHGALRGCIGVLEAVRPLVADVAHNAHAAAFSDPRFPRVVADELDALEFHISVLSPPEDFPVASPAELLRALRPGIDGLILEEGWRRATFLPSVWESLTDPREFVGHLKRKAGLDEDHWSDRLRFKRYTTVSIEA